MFTSSSKLARIVYTAPRGSHRGFAEAFDIYATRTTKGDNYQKVTSGNANITQNSVEIKFNLKLFNRIKFVFKSPSIALSIDSDEYCPPLFFIDFILLLSNL